MMHERISLNGVSVVGFGDEEGEKALLEGIIVAPAVGLVVGVIGGTVVGQMIKAGVGTAAGAIVGGFGGVIAGAAVGMHIVNTAAKKERAANPTSTTPAATVSPSPVPITPVPTPAPSPAASGWKPVQANSTVKAGQRIAVAVAGMSGIPLPPEFIAQGSRMFEAAAATKPELNAVAYPPGSLLPPNWPEDDDLGPGAYRYMVDAPVTAPLTSVAEIPTAGIPEMGVLMMFKAWARDKS